MSTRSSTGHRRRHPVVANRRDVDAIVHGGAPVGETAAVPSFGDLAAADPDLAALVADRFGARPAYLATTRADGAPRVHPVTPVIGDGRLWVFMEPTSPKGADLRARPRYALHAGVPDAAGTGGEAWVAGTAAPVDDSATRAAAAAAATYEPADRYGLFELHVDEAATTTYDGGPPTRRRWRA